MPEKLHKKIDQALDGDAIPQKMLQVMKDFVTNYVQTALSGGSSMDQIEEFFDRYLGRLQYLHDHPFKFEPYHKQILEPFDYYQLGLDFIIPLVNQTQSQYLGDDSLQKIEEQLACGENVILLANHQAEIDPQIISLLTEKKHPKLAKEMIFVAGDRVILDHLAVPFSMGRNLLCIYSKKHIGNPPSKMEEKRLHNKKTMQRMAELLKEGGKCIYVAPSGGRDRPNESGEFEVSEFDPQSIELFYLMTKKSQKNAHFYPLTLLTHKTLPPPNDVESELGEVRSTEYSGVYASFGNEIDMNRFDGHDHENKVERRHARADYIYQHILKDYQTLKKMQDQHEK